MSQSSDHPIKIGKAQVATKRERTPVNIYYEIHGNGSKRILLVMGLGMTCRGWDFQSSYFGSMPEYSVLVFDNRGCGWSDSPYGLYSTTQMAQDTIELLEHIGWTSDVHLVGISMGGMISLEAIFARPDMFKSLCLTVTTAGRIMAPLSAVNGIIRLAFFTPTPEGKTKAMVEMLYPRSWLDQAPEDNKEFNSNREAVIYRNAQHRSLTRVQPLHGNLAQSVACIRHFVSDERLHVIRDTGVPIMVITGTWDNLVDPRNSHHLAEELQSDFEVFIRSGHAIPLEKPRRYNELLLAHFRKADKDNVHAA